MSLLITPPEVKRLDFGLTLINKFQQKIIEKKA